MTFPVFAVLTRPSTPLLLDGPDGVVLPLWADRDAAEAYLARTGVRAAGLLRLPGPRALAALLRSDSASEVTAVAVDPSVASHTALTTLPLPDLFADARRAA